MSLFEILAYLLLFTFKQHSYRFYFTKTDSKHRDPFHCCIICPWPQDGADGNEQATTEGVPEIQADQLRISVKNTKLERK